MLRRKRPMSNCEKVNNDNDYDSRRVVVFVVVVAAIVVVGHGSRKNCMNCYCDSYRQYCGFFIRNNCFGKN